MSGSPWLLASFIMSLVIALFVICSIILVLVILIQRGRGGGLGAAFGAGLPSGLLGSKTGDFLTWVTIVLVSIFLVLAVVMVKYYKPTVSGLGPTPPEDIVPASTAQPGNQSDGSQIPAQSAPPAGVNDTNTDANLSTW